MQNNLSLKITNFKNIKSVNFDFPIERGISVLTGENGSGKSTIMGILATKFSQYQITEFSSFDYTDNTEISIKYKDKEIKYNTVSGRLEKTVDMRIPLYGFFEGSIIHGTRFRDTTKDALKAADNVNPEYLIEADKFVVENLGKILHNSESYYTEIFRIKKKEIAQDQLFLKNVPYFIKHNSTYINQFHMSTGECLLISLLHLLNNTIIRRSNEFRHGDPYIILIDEIEMALHPSAITRLLTFLEELVESENVCILFSSHSIEVIRRIKSNRIFYIAYNSGKLIIENPSFPAYVTRDLYLTDGFDFLLLVEDDLAKYVIDRIISQEKLYNNRLIQVLPCGGWSQVLSMNMDIYKSKLAGPNVSIVCILDGDIKENVTSFERANPEYKVVVKNYLPIKSIEKYLLERLVKNENYDFKKNFFNKFIHLSSSSDVINEYKKKFTKDTDGKLLFGYLSALAIHEGIKEGEIRRMFCEFIFENENFQVLTEFLKDKLKFA